MAKVMPRKFKIVELCTLARINRSTLYRETRNLLKDPRLIEQIFNSKRVENAKTGRD